MKKAEMLKLLEQVEDDTDINLIVVANQHHARTIRIWPEDRVDFVHMAEYE